jgi:phosphoribosylglycinamide formyltransferase-1
MGDARIRAGVLVSGLGTNLGALLDVAGRESFPAEVVLVISNRPAAGALEIARRHGVEAVVMPVARHGGDVAARDAAMRDRLLAAGVRLVVLAGYDRVLSAAFYGAFPNAIINVHPSLLPAFGGSMHGVAQALAYGVKVAGCTVQLLEPGEPDGGPIILQATVPVHEDDDAERLHRRIHEQEWVLVPEAVSLWCSGRLRREGRRVRILPPHLRGEPGVAVADVIPQEA